MKKLILCLSLIVFISNAFSQSKQFRFEYDYSRFSYNDSSSYLEIYYSFYQPLFKYLIDERNHKSIHGSLKVILKDMKNNQQVVEKEYQFTSLLEDTLNNNDQKSLIGNLGYIIPFGDYECILIGKDLNAADRLDR